MSEADRHDGPESGRPVDAAEESAGDVPARLVVSEDVMEEIGGQLRSAYPREGCGVLLGTVRGAERVVRSTRPAANRWDEREDRYLVDPGTLRRLMDQESDGGPTILGFYHSHPDAPARPSPTDRELAWPWYLYLILRTEEAGEEEVRTAEAGVWQLDGESGEFVERELRIAGDDEGAG